MIGIAGMGFYFPRKQQAVEDISLKMNLSEADIARAGIKRVFIPDKNDDPSFMAYKSALQALSDANMTPDDIDLIIVPVFRNDYYNWQMSIWLKGKLKANNATTIDFKGGCAAHFLAVEFAFHQIHASKAIKTILITSSERLTGYGWPVFYSSGSQSIILKEDCGQFNYLGFAFENGIEFHDFSHVKYGGTAFPFSDTTEWKNDDVYSNVTVDKEKYYSHIKPGFYNKFNDVCTRLFLQTSVRKEEISYVITLVQQKTFSERLLNAIGLSNVECGEEFRPYMGHFSGADMYIILDKARKAHKIQKGNKILVLSMGGLMWFSAIIEY